LFARSCRASAEERRANRATRAERTTTLWLIIVVVGVVGNREVVVETDGDEIVRSSVRYYRTAGPTVVFVTWSDAKSRNGQIAPPTFKIK
jgi:hypothetical protein